MDCVVIEEHLKSKAFSVGEVGEIVIDRDRMLMTIGI